jgi:hypothetical protein
MNDGIPRSGSPEVRKSGSPYARCLIASLGVNEQLAIIHREPEVHQTSGLPDFRTSGLGDFP